MSLSESSLFPNWELKNSDNNLLKSNLTSYFFFLNFHSYYSAESMGLQFVGQHENSHFSSASCWNPPRRSLCRYRLHERLQRFHWRRCQFFAQPISTLTNSLEMGGLPELHGSAAPAGTPYDCHFRSRSRSRLRFIQEGSATGSLFRYYLESANGSPDCTRSDKIWYQSIRRGVTKILKKLKKKKTKPRKLWNNLKVSIYLE